MTNTINLWIICLLLAPMSANAQTLTKQTETKYEISLVTGAAFGDTSYGVTTSYLLDPHSSIDLSLSKSGDSRKGSKFLGLGYRFFFSETLNLRSGIGYFEGHTTGEYSYLDLARNSVKVETKDIAGEVTVGNQWVIDNEISFSIDWLGVYFPVHPLNSKATPENNTILLNLVEARKFGRKNIFEEFPLQIKFSFGYRF